VESDLFDYVGEHIVVISHHNADPDAVGSAYGVKELIEQLKANAVVHVVMPDDISRLSTNLITELGLEVLETPPPIYDTIIVVDTSSIDQLGLMASFVREKDSKIILIDHHIISEELSQYADLLICDQYASSASELVYRIFEKYDVQPSPHTSKALLAGIAFDTKFFSIGDSKTFLTVSKLLKDLGDVSEIRSLLSLKSDISERIARLKTGQRAELYRVKDWLIVWSEVGSFQASGARALISLGADLAIVAGSDKENIRASLRSRQEFFDATGLHLGELVFEYCTAAGGTGSGHPTAAGYNGVGELAVFKESILEKIMKNIPD